MYFWIAGVHGVRQAKRECYGKGERVGMFAIPTSGWRRVVHGSYALLFTTVLTFRRSLAPPNYIVG